MATLWVANPTQQDHTFMVLRVEYKPGSIPYVQRPLPAGSQIKIENIDPEEIKKTMEHYRQYGARTPQEARKEKNFVGLLFSDEKEISFDALSETAGENIGVLEVEGKNLRDAASVVADEALLRQTPGSAQLKGTDVEIREMEPRDKSAMQTKATDINEKRRVEDKTGKSDRRGKAVVPGR